MAEKKREFTVKEKLELYQYKQNHPTVRVSAYLINFSYRFTDNFPWAYNLKIPSKSQPEADDNLAPIRKAEVDDDLIILEEVNSGESGVMVAAPTRTEVQNTKKRKQPAITDFFF